MQNKGGRPKIEQSLKKKNQVVCYLDEVEFILLKKRIKITREKKSEVLKNSFIKELNSNYKEPRKFNAEEINFLNEISRLNNTLNQIAKRLNSGQVLGGIDVVKLYSTIHELQNDIEDLKQII